MAPIGEGRENAQISMPKGTKERLDQLRARMTKEAEGLGEDASAFSDRGVMVEWLVDTVEGVLAHREQIASVEIEAQQRVREARALMVQVDERLREADQREQEISTQRLSLQRQEGLSGWILDLFAYLEGQGLDREHILQVARVIRDSGLQPEDVAAAFRRENIGGLLGYAQRLRDQIAEAQEAKNRLLEEFAAIRQATDTLTAERQATEQAIAGANQEAQRTVQAAQLAALRMEELGVYADWLRSIGVRRVEDLPLETARLLAGVIILGAVQSHGDGLVTIPPKPGSMLLGGEILLSELPYLLAPREAYARMQQATQERSAMAQHMSASGSPPQGAQ